MKLTWTTFLAMNTPTEWRARFMRNKWILAWTGAAALFGYMVYVAVAHANKPWQGAVLQTMGTAIPIYAAILIYLQSKAAGDKAMRAQLDHLQRMNREAMDHLSAQTNRQITEYSRETLKVVSKLEENSLLLGEILKRNLENVIDDYEEREKEANNGLAKAESFQLLRTPEQKAAEIQQWRLHLERVRGLKNFFVNMYHRVSSLFTHHGIQP